MKGQLNVVEYLIKQQVQEVSEDILSLPNKSKGCSNGVQWKATANCLGLSPRTLYRRRIQYGIADAYNDKAEQELESNIRDILRFAPFSGETYIGGVLRARGIYIHRWKVREVLQTIDPINRAIRRRYAIQRRLYNEKKSNHLWHIDSNHKLTSWRFFLHGCIDGYSRADLFEVFYKKSRE